MKKYTNKILVIAMAVVLAVSAVMLFISASKVDKQIKQGEIIKVEGGDYEY